MKFFSVIQLTILYPFMNTLCWKILFSNVKSDLKIAFNLLSNKSKNSCNAYRTFFPTLKGFLGFAACHICTKILVKLTLNSRIKHHWGKLDKMFKRKTKFKQMKVLRSWWWNNPSFLLFLMLLLLLFKKSFIWLFAF